MARKVSVVAHCENCGAELKFFKGPETRTFISEEVTEIVYCIRCGAQVHKNGSVVKCPLGCAFSVKNLKISQNGKEGRVLTGRLELCQNPRSMREFYCPVCGEPIEGFEVKRLRV